MLALSIRQPYAELILRGIKTIEFRSRPTRIIGERFYIYAARGPAIRRADDAAAEGRRIWSDDLAITTPRRGEHPPKWMLELARLLIAGELPTGVIVGSAVIEKVTRANGSGRATDSARATDPGGAPVEGLFEWHLTGVERLQKPRKPARHPQPAWFRPF